MPRTWISSVILFFCVTLGQLSAQDEPLPPNNLESLGANTQDLIFPDHPVYKRWRDLFILAGQALPSSAAPISRHEMLTYLAQLPEASSPVESQKRKLVLDQLTPKPLFSQNQFSFQLVNALHPEIYFGNVTDAEDWDRTYSNRPALWRSDFRFWGGSFLAFAFDLPLSQEPFAVLDKTGPLNSNILTSLGEWNKYFPFRSYLAVGGEFWSLQWGRGKLSYGPGRTGNLLLSDAADWADFWGLSLFWEGFKFQTFIINQDWYEYALDTLNQPIPHPSGWYRSAEGAQAKSRFHTFHRLEFRPWKNFTIALSEAGAVETNGFDFRFLNPFYVYHNWFLSENSDSNAALDWEWTIVRGINFYGAFLADYITTPYKDQVFHDSRPLAFGLQLGTEILQPLEVNLLRYLVEVVYLSPYAYTDRNFNWVQWRRHLSDYGEIRGRALLEQPLGYILGPGSFQLMGAVSFEWPSLFSLGLDSRFITKGTTHLLSRNPSHPDYNQPGLNPPPYEKPGNRLLVRTWVEWELASVGLPPFWTLRLDVLSTSKWGSNQQEPDWILQSALGLGLEW